MTGASSGRLPLAGLVVIDFGQIFQGPYATLLLASGGAVAAWDGMVRLWKGPHREG